MDVDWRELELDEIPEWPPLARRLFLAIVGGVVLFLGVFFVVIPSNDEVMLAKQDEQLLKTQFRIKAERVKALPDVDEQMQALSRFYTNLTQQLPQHEELAQLLAGINDVGLQYGLSFERLNWGTGEQVGWLYKVPLSIELTGNYEGIGQFSESMARLPRIVALQDFKLSRQEQNSEKLHFSVAAHTYRYVEKGVVTR